MPIPFPFTVVAEAREAIPVTGSLTMGMLEGEWDGEMYRIDDMDTGGAVILNGVPDYDLMVRRGSAPTYLERECSSSALGPTEVCPVSAGEGAVYAFVRAYSYVPVSHQLAVVD
jgi:hypothetical protein